MAVQGLEQTKSKLDQLKQFGGWVLIAIVVAAILVGGLIVSGAIGFMPLQPLVVFGIVIPETWVAFLAAFTVAIGMILAYVYFYQLVLSTISRMMNYWEKMPQWVKVGLFALQAAIIAGLAMWLTHQYHFAFQMLTLVAIPVVAFILTFDFTGRLLELGWTFKEWMRTMYVSALIGAVVATLSTFAFAEVAPGYLPAAVFLAGWTVGIYLFYRRRHHVGDDAIARILTKTGYAQMRQVETASVSLLSGLGAGVVIAILVGFFGTTPGSLVQRAVLSIVLVWPVVTIATSIGWPSYERQALVIDDISVRSSTDLRELTVRNIGDAPVSLHNAKIQDAHNNLYHIAIRASLSAGESGKFEIPQDFELAARGQYEVGTLPFGLTIMKEAHHPRIVTRDGKLYVLRWIDQVRQANQQETTAGAGATASS